MSHKQPLQRKSFLDKIADDVMNNFCFLCKSPEEILGKLTPPLPHGTSSKYSLYELEPQMKQWKKAKAVLSEREAFKLIQNRFVNVHGGQGSNVSTRKSSLSFQRKLPISLQRYLKGQQKI